MGDNIYRGPERRKFIRLDYVTPMDYKVCKKETISKLLKGYTVNISQTGLLCSIKDKVKENDILWLSFDRDTLSICQDVEKRSFIYQHGIVGKVVRSEAKDDGTYRVGIKFITLEEKNLTHIYPKSYFGDNRQQDEPEEQDEHGLETE